MRSRASQPSLASDRHSCRETMKMALNERLTKFKQQQERLQTALSSIAASQASTPKSKSAPCVPPINSQFTPENPPQQIKFSEDTQRLQLINSVRKSPVGAQIKLVIELLSKKEAFLN
ncbi:hypothetical protein GUJ93_ZPchr0006g44220 [Zizania palustris]|uniref:Uncharacterized protein n=1 Tax=Zizania palustris TaxID=103762 RepID=A0A8J5T3Y5_ZIZPA|nr:hypothetical protein GUJ93_ZPchr0006g44220 [Zizania palustris]